MEEGRRKGEHERQSERASLFAKERVFHYRASPQHYVARDVIERINDAN